MKFDLALQKLKPKPADIIVLTIKKEIDFDGLAKLKKRLNTFFTDNGLSNPILLLEPGFAISAKSIKKIKAELDECRS